MGEVESTTSPPGRLTVAVPVAVTAPRAVGLRTYALSDGRVTVRVPVRKWSAGKA